MNLKKEHEKNQWNQDMDALEQELHLLERQLPGNQTLEERIQKELKKRIQKIVCRTLGILAVLLLLLLLIINPFCNALFLNPQKLNQDGDSVMLRTLESYWETTQPYTQPVYLDVSKKGFGRYHLQMQITNGREFIRYGMPNVQVDFFQGHYNNWQDPHLITTFQANRFDFVWTEQEELTEKIRELPASSIVYLSVGAASPKPLSDLKKEAIQLSWAEIYQPDCEFQGGLALSKAVYSERGKSREEMTVQELQETYLSNLDTLLAHPELWKSMELKTSSLIFPAQRSEELLRDCREQAEKLETLSTKNYCIFGKRDQIVAYLEKEEFRSLQVDEIKLSEF